MIKNTEEITLSGARDDLCIILEELLTLGRPSAQSMSQLEYNQEQLTELITETDKIEFAHDAANLLKTINVVLKTFNEDNQGLIKNAKPYGKYNSHVTLPGTLLGKTLLVLELKNDEK